MSIRILLVTLACLTCQPAQSQTSVAAPTTIETAFETYKACVLEQKSLNNKKLTTKDYPKVCARQRARLKNVAKDSFPAIEVMIEQWIATLND